MHLKHTVFTCTFTFFSIWQKLVSKATHNWASEPPNAGIKSLQMFIDLESAVEMSDLCLCQLNNYLVKISINQQIIQV